MKRISSIILLCLLSIISGCSSDNSATGDEKITLQVATHTNTEHYSYDIGIGPWMERVTELTNGRVEFEVFPNEQISEGKDNLRLVQRNMIDITYILYAEDRIPLLDIIALPGMYDTAYQGSRAYFDIATEGIMLEEAFLPNGIRPLITFTMSPSTIGTVNNKIESMEDFQGMNMRTAEGSVNLTVDKLNATPITMSIGDSREALQRGTIDGVVTSWTSVMPNQLDGPLNYMMAETPLNGFQGSFAINEEKYQSLPTYVQDAIDQANEEITISMAEQLHEEETQAIEMLREQGTEIYELSDELYNEIEDEAMKVTQEQIDEFEDKGHNAQTVYDAFQEAAKKYDEN